MGINLLAVIFAAAANMIIGMIWYSDKAFGKEWRQLEGLSGPKKTKKEMNKSLLLGALSALVMAYVMAHFIAVTGAVTAAMGMSIGFWIWLGFIATVAFGGVVWSKKPIQLFYINSGYWLATMLLMGAILGAWR